MFDIGFLTIKFWDILDIAIVGYLISQIYKLLKGSIAFNIFIGVMTMYIVWAIVKQLEMNLLSLLLDQLVSVGVIIIIIVFQPEVRKFLLLIGNTTLRQRSNFLNRILDKNFMDVSINDESLNHISNFLFNMAKQKEGALIVLSKGLDLSGIQETGVEINATISEALLASIFNKNAPLHDGAAILSNDKVLQASCVLPISDNTQLPKWAGLRHRAAVGISERIDVGAFVVSEESGKVSFAHQGQLQTNLNEQQVKTLLKKYYE